MGMGVVLLSCIEITVTNNNIILLKHHGFLTSFKLSVNFRAFIAQKICFSGLNGRLG